MPEITEDSKEVWCSWIISSEGGESSHREFLEFWKGAYQEEYDPGSMDDQQIKRAFMEGARRQRRGVAKVLDIFHEDWADDPRCNECTYELLDNLSMGYIRKLKCL